MSNNKYTPVIGLEVHVELKTNSKMFCGCSANYFGKAPNSHTCPVCLGLPGALPVPNQKAIEWCIKIALALNCQINELSKFDRKNYFYPDLAKGYQISQYDLPFGYDGHVILGNGVTPESQKGKDSGQAGMTKKIRIRRVHMEEDTGKLSHQEIHGDKLSLIDFNRSGVPLVEIVTEPDFHDAQEVKEYLQKLQQIVRYLDVSNADMDKGEMRLEPNISLAVTSSLRDHGMAKQSLSDEIATSPKAPRNDIPLPNYKVEVKNINSFKFVEKAVNFEIKRQTEILDEGETPAQETRGWNEFKQKTFSQRSKEEAHDYRYFPEPDIPPIRFSKSQISNLKSQMPELPDEKFARFVKDYTLPTYDAEILTRDKNTADYFEEAAGLANEHKLKPKTIANTIINKKIGIGVILPAALIKQILAEKQTISIDEEELEKIFTEVIAENEKAVTEYKNGKEPVIMFLVGQSMKKIGKKVDAQIVKEKLKEKLV